MFFNGKAWISCEYVMELLEIKNRSMLCVNPFKSRFKNVERLKMGQTLYFEQKAFYDVLRTEEKRENAIINAQRLLMYILDEVETTKSEFSKKIGFKSLANLEMFLKVGTRGNRNIEEMVTKCDKLYPKLSQSYKMLYAI